MQRRDLVLGAAMAALARPSLAQPAVGGKAKTLIHVPQANLTSLDPVWTTAVVTRNCAAMVFETLYGRDEKLDPKPQMVEGHKVEDNGLRWTMRLRDGLLFHDGAPVLARDCVASLLRWMKRDSIGQTIADRMDALEAPDDKTLVFRLHKPFASLPYALAKTQPTPVIMPERLAKTDPFKQVPEIVGSGPFRFVANEYVAGNLAVFAKFDRYNPRPEPASFAAGGYRVMVDRVEWRIIPDCRHRGECTRRRRGRLARCAAARPAADAAQGTRRDGRTDRYLRHVRWAAAELPARPHRKRRRPPCNSCRDRPGRGDDSGDGRRKEPVSRAGRLFPARHAVGQRCRAWMRYASAVAPTKSRPC